MILTTHADTPNLAPCARNGMESCVVIGGMPAFAGVLRAR